VIEVLHPTVSSPRIDFRYRFLEVFDYYVDVHMSLPTVNVLTAFCNSLDIFRLVSLLQENLNKTKIVYLINTFFV
jgi:hypothetical protein